jgi:hypothetical protein
MIEISFTTLVIYGLFVWLFTFWIGGMIGYAAGYDFYKRNKDTIKD